MRKTKYYAIDYRNMNTGIHGLIFYLTESSAIKNIDKLKKGIKELEKRTENKEISEKEAENLYYILVNEVMLDGIHLVDEINFKTDIVDKTPKKRLIRYYTGNPYAIVEIINLVSLDLYI